MKIRQRKTKTFEGGKPFFLYMGVSNLRNLMYDFTSKDTNKIGGKKKKRIQVFLLQKAASSVAEKRHGIN